MKSVSHIVWVETVVVVFAGLQARDLLTAWAHSPSDRTGWGAFLLWLTPAVRMLWRHKGRGPTNRLLVLTALTAALTGGICQVNFLNYLALALAFAGRWPLAWKHEIIWLALSIGWMPVMGVLAAHAGLPVLLVDGVRVILGLMAAILGTVFIPGIKKQL